MTAWLPLISSVVVVVALSLTIVAANRSHRRAIIAADERAATALEAAQRTTEATHGAAAGRDHDRWRREKILDAVSDILAVSEEVTDRLDRRADWSADTVDEAESQILQTLERLPVMVNVIRLLADEALLEECDKLGQALYSVTRAAAATVAREPIAFDEHKKQIEHYIASYRAIQAVELDLVAAARTELGATLVRVG
ncbi:hypothetical protein GV794_10875 [Nocardia cyriacigeorgica]|uniref:Uncharacterized protein n=2 Tax=Nocardia cyriacigeorgica TaxID=135487 RepID=A0A6P1D6E3_9NOCA|nr:hypothetical protein [Nocardia cyriacigeorgica]NEW37770.1 hypothetical protein [Nocardia cyriacigeorgica]NEW45628.1 hypothetical protein [Nocardia cyriacigeorgica]NEW48845.1 hypothetical protein [Nocardia cyriacigeorgica]NEW56152.1 hypothetical protein [Nocardia cyriacigeorgica]